MNIEERLDRIELKLSEVIAAVNEFAIRIGTMRPWDLAEPDDAPPDRDPYLVPGAPCEVWYEGGYDKREILYFSHHDEDGVPRFCTKAHNLGGGPFSGHYYRVFGTIWDHAPEWAEAAVVWTVGEIDFFSKENMAIAERHHRQYPKTTLHRRPAWARSE